MTLRVWVRDAVDFTRTVSGNRADRSSKLPLGPELITVWNAQVMAMPRWGQPRFLADLHERMRDPRMPPEMVDAMRTLSQRRLELFANDGRAVGEWSVVMEVGEWRMRCDARVPNARPGTGCR